MFEYKFPASTSLTTRESAYFAVRPDDSGPVKVYSDLEAFLFSLAAPAACAVALLQAASLALDGTQIISKQGKGAIALAAVEGIAVSTSFTAKDTDGGADETFTASSTVGQANLTRFSGIVTVANAAAVTRLCTSMPFRMVYAMYNAYYYGAIPRAIMEGIDR